MEVICTYQPQQQHLKARILWIPMIILSLLSPKVSLTSLYEWMVLVLWTDPNRSESTAWMVRGGFPFRICLLDARNFLMSIVMCSDKVGTSGENNSNYGFSFDLCLNCSSIKKTWYQVLLNIIMYTDSYTQEIQHIIR